MRVEQRQADRLETIHVTAPVHGLLEGQLAEGGEPVPYDELAPLARSRRASRFRPRWHSHAVGSLPIHESLIK